ncbi:MAG TPA: EF-Tu/IF-2/RF-3 family GTPase [Anaerolineales bacterium]|nr:EF-Tu/IF-2/RF-3 family GTPase [Anaerolineales bacterium]
MSTDPFFRLTVEDVFSIVKRGTVVTGKIEGGTLRVGDEVAIQGQNGQRKTVVSGIEMFRKTVSQASAGDNVGILFKDISRQDVQAGDVLLCPGSDFTWKS